MDQNNHFELHFEAVTKLNNVLCCDVAYQSKTYQAMWENCKSKMAIQESLIAEERMVAEHLIGSGHDNWAEEQSQRSQA